jgi:hypothetical protein
MSETVTIPVDQYQQINSKLAALEAANAQAESARQNAETRRLIEAGQSDAVVKLHREQLAAADERGRKMAVTSEIARNLSGYTLAGEHAAAQLTTLLAGQLTADSAPEGYNVRTPSFQSAGDFIKSTLASPEYSHFLRPSGAPVNRPGTPALPIEQPKNLGAAIVMQFNSDTADRDAANGHKSALLDPSRGFLKGIVRR